MKRSLLLITLASGAALAQGPDPDFLYSGANVPPNFQGLGGYTDAFLAELNGNGLDDWIGIGSDVKVVVYMDP